MLSFYSAILFRWYTCWYQTHLLCNGFLMQQDICTCIDGWANQVMNEREREREREIQSVQPSIFSSDWSGSIISNSPWRRSWEKRRKEDYSITYGSNKIFVRILPKTYSSLSNVMSSLFDMRNVSRREEQSCQAVQFEWLLWLIWSRLSVQLPVDGKTHQI